MDNFTRRSAMRMLGKDLAEQDSSYRKWRVRRNYSRERNAYIWSLYPPANFLAISTAQTFDEALAKFPRVAKNYIERNYTRVIKTLGS